MATDDDIIRLAKAVEEAAIVTAENTAVLMEVRRTLAGMRGEIDELKAKVAALEVTPIRK